MLFELSYSNPKNSAENKKRFHKQKRKRFARVSVCFWILPHNEEDILLQKEQLEAVAFEAVFGIDIKAVFEFHATRFFGMS